MYDRTGARRERLRGTKEETWRMKGWHFLAAAVVIALILYCLSYSF